VKYHNPRAWAALALWLMALGAAQAADSPALKDNAREYLALRQTLKAPTLTPAQFSGPKSAWRGKTVELFGRIIARTNARVPGSPSPVSVMLMVPGVTDLVIVDSAAEDPLLVVDQVVHVLADLADDARPTDHFGLRAIISEDDLPAAEQSYDAAEAAAQARQALNTKPTGALLPAPSPEKNAKPSSPVGDVTPQQKPEPPQLEQPVARPGTQMPQLNAVASKAVGAWKKWVGGINPRLGDGELEVIVRSVLYYSALYGLDHRLAFAMIKCESDFDPKCLSHSGAMGLTQLMPCNATDMGVNPWDLEQNIRGGLKYLSDQLHRFPEKSNYDQCVLGLACYNAGPGAVKRAGGVPNYPETVRYVQKVGDLFYQLWKAGMP
jgi:soluble lytic murein transglycosylase-like protein